MKQHYHTTAEPVETTIKAMSGWLSQLHALHHHLRPYFARPRPHHHALLYLQAILSEIPRKNGWQIAEHARQPQPYGIQRLLSHATWDQDGVRNELRSFVFHALTRPSSEISATASPFPVLVLDESGFPKRGRHSAGVGPQYCGLTGRVENCQVGVFLSYVTEQGHALIDRELYLPEDWCSDLPRRRAAHIPDTVCFRTKPELAHQMVIRAQAACLPFRWVVADTVYGHSPDLRQGLEQHGHAYALAVPCTEVICVHTETGPLLRDVGTIVRQQVRRRDWQRFSQSLGTKGERLFDWAMLPWMQADIVDGRHFLVIRRCLDDPGQLAYYLVFTPLSAPLSTIAQAIGARWHIEEDFSLAKDVGLDHYEVRSFLGWYRHVTLVLLACAFLLSVSVLSPPSSSPSPDPSAAPTLIPLTTCEIRHLLARLIFPPPTSAPLICQWSQWRRVHQYWAGYHHRRRRDTLHATRSPPLSREDSL
jgi:SRSO17 transposase